MNGEEVPLDLALKNLAWRIQTGVGIAYPADDRERVKIQEIVRQSAKRAPTGRVDLSVEGFGRFRSIVADTVQSVVHELLRHSNRDVSAGSEARLLTENLIIILFVTWSRWGGRLPGLGVLEQNGYFKLDQLDAVSAELSRFYFGFSIEIAKNSQSTLTDRIARVLIGRGWNEEEGRGLAAGLVHRLYPIEQMFVAEALRKRRSSEGRRKRTSARRSSS